VSLSQSGADAEPKAGGRLLKLGLWVATVTLVLDQASKWYVLGPMDLPMRGRVPVAPFLDFVLVWNTGISYGLLSSEGDLGRILLALLAAAATGLMIFWLRRETRPGSAVALGLLIGGAIGNAIDRLVHGAVVDFALLHGGGYEWYVFNIADAAIVVGVVMLLVSGVLPERKATEPA
jgi:signal peptidase II